MNRLRAVVLGDPMLDRWDLYLTARPQGPEGVPVLVSNNGYTALGGALNLAANLAACDDELLVYFGQLGGACGGVIEDLAKEARVTVQTVELTGVFQETAIKRRVIVDGTMVHRVDRDVPVLRSASPRRVRSWLSEKAPDILILSDYGKGSLWPPGLAVAAVEWFRESKARLLIIDGKPALLSYFFGNSNGSVIRDDPRVIFRCNSAESKQIAQWPISNSRASFVVTEGARGAMVFSVADSPTWPVITLDTRLYEPKSVVGAGDAFTAAMAYFRGVEELSVRDAVERACYAANSACAGSQFTVRINHDRDLCEPVAPELEYDD